MVVAKGARSPLCYPDVIGTQLAQSLDRLQTDHVEIYFMHRDNPDVPVCEFDAVDIEVKAGRMRGPFGGSNWTMQRMDEAIAYAQRIGSRSPVRSPTVSRWPKWWGRSGRVASPRPPMTGRRG